MKCNGGRGMKKVNKLKCGCGKTVKMSLEMGALYIKKYYRKTNLGCKCNDCLLDSFKKGAIGVMVCCANCGSTRYPYKKMTKSLKKTVKQLLVER